MSPRASAGRLVFGLLASANVLLAIGLSPAAAQTLPAGGLVAHFDAQDVDGDGSSANNPSDNAEVPQWADLSGGGRHLTPAASKPRYRTGSAALGGKNYVEFTSDVSRTPTLSATEAAGATRDTVNLFAVVRYNSGDVLFRWGDTATSRLGCQGASRWDFPSDATSGSTAVGQLTGWVSTLSGTGWRILELRASGGKAVYLDGTRVASTSMQGALSASAFSRMCLGGINPDTSLQADVDYAEFIYYNRALSPAERHAVGRMLATKYGLTAAYTDTPAVSALPVTHGLVLNLDAQRLYQDGVSANPANNDVVRFWGDATDNAFDVAALDTTKRPLYKTNAAAINGKNYVEFLNSTGGRMSRTRPMPVTTLAGPTRKTITSIYVMRFVTGSVIMQWESSNLNRFGMENNRWDMPSDNTTTGQLKSWSPALGTGWRIVVLWSDGTTKKVFVDGTLAGSQALSGALATSTSSTFALGAQPGNWNPASVDFAQIIHYNRALTDNEINLFGYQLETTYGLSTTYDNSGFAVENGAGGLGLTPTSAALRGTVVSPGTTSLDAYVFWGTEDKGTDASAWAHSARVASNLSGTATLGTNLSYVTTGLLRDFANPYRYAVSNATVGLVWAPTSATASGTFVTDGFGRRLPINFTGYTGTDALGKFPALVRLTAEQLGTAANGSGYDIRFTDANGAPLDYEVQTWNATDGWNVWVKVPVLTAATRVWAYLGNDAVDGYPSTYARKGAVWTGGTVGKWHFDEQVANNQTTGLHLDATASNLNASQYRNETVAGVIGRAQRVARDGSSIEYMRVPSDPALNVGSSLTVSGWLRWQGSFPEASPRVISRKNAFGDADGWDLLARRTAALQPHLYVRGNGTTFTATFDGSGALPRIDTSNPNWWHLTVVFQGTSATAYTNGVAVGTGVIDAAVDNTRPLTFGNLGTADAASTYSGDFDEWRFDGTARSADWVQAVWKNMSDNSSFLTVGPAQALGGTVLMLR